MNSRATPTVDDPHVARVTTLSTILANHVVPLYHDDNWRRPVPHGTAFLVKSGNLSFLISAAHVFADHRSLYFYVEPTLKRSLNGLPCWTNNVTDTVVFKLDGPQYSLPPYTHPQMKKYSMSVSVLLPNTLPREGRTYLVVGFPASKGRPRLKHRDITATAYGWWSNSIPTKDYGKIAISAKTHIAVPFDQKKITVEGQFPSPKGMSGSPVFLYDEKGTNDPANIPVVGIFTEYKPSHKVMVATDIGCALWMIKRLSGS